MSAPKRIQLHRTKGYRKPEGAIVVARPSRWGNQFKVGELYRLPGNGEQVRVRDRAHAVELYRVHRLPLIVSGFARLDLAELRGHDLACWCKPTQPCHADVLLELANA